MKKKFEGIKISYLIYNLLVVGSVIVALTSGFKFGG